MTEKRRHARADAAQAAKGRQKAYGLRSSQKQEPSVPFRETRRALGRWRNSSRSSDGFRPNVLRSGGCLYRKLDPAGV
jgi:hypothetical protein